MNFGASRAAMLGVAAVAAGMLIGCGGNDETEATVGTGTSPKQLEGSFVSTSDVQEDGTAFSSPVTVDIYRSAIGWKARCNSFSISSVRFTDDQLILGEDKNGMGSVGTLMACPEKEQQQDDDLTTFFESDPNWSLDGNRLTLSNDAVTVDLQRDATPPDS